MANWWLLWRPAKAMLTWKREIKNIAILVNFKIDEIIISISIVFLFSIIIYCIIIVEICNDLYFSFYICYNIFLFVHLLVLFVLWIEGTPPFFYWTFPFYGDRTRIISNCDSHLVSKVYYKCISRTKLDDGDLDYCDAY